MNKLYFGDNLEILRELDDARIHLICTDPPFNSGRDYNAFIGDSLAQKKAFTIEPVSARMRQEAENMGNFEHNQKNYPRLQFWQLDDTYFENPDNINTHVRLPNAWRIRPTQKSERHFDNRQMQLLSG